MRKPGERPTYTSELDQLAIALALGKYAKLLEVAAGGESPEQQARIIPGLSFAIEKLKMYSQCFAPGHPAHPWPLNSADRAWMSNAKAMNGDEATGPAERARRQRIRGRKLVGI